MFLLKCILGDVYEIDLKKYVDLTHVCVNGSFFHLLTADPTLCDFVIMKAAISVQGDTLEGITHKEWDISFYALFSKLFPNREEEIRSLVESSKSPYLLKSEKCVCGHFQGPSQVEALDEGEENTRAKTAAVLAKTGGGDLGIGIIHMKESTVICIDGKKGIVSTVVPHTGISLDPEDQISKVVVEQIAILLEDHFDVHSTLSFGL